MFSELLFKFSYLVLVCTKNIQIASAVNEGKHVPKGLVFALLSKRLEEGYARGESGFILDGIPRTLIQAVSVLLLFFFI